MNVMTVKDVEYSEEHKCIILTCIDGSGNQMLAPATPTLAPKIGDKV